MPFSEVLRNATSSDHKSAADDRYLSAPAAGRLSRGMSGGQFIGIELQRVYGFERGRGGADFGFFREVGSLPRFQAEPPPPG
jgi:hypothetical protein